MTLTRGADPAWRPKRKLPSSLAWTGERRHELGESLANRLLCEVLQQLALKKAHRLTSRPDPIVEYAGARYRLVGDLLEGTLYDIAQLVPRFHIHESSISPAGKDSAPSSRWDVDRSVPPARALERVRYVMPDEPRQTKAIQQEIAI